MSAKEARDNFNDLLNRAYYQHEPIIVERQGKPVAVVVSPADFARYQKLAKEEFFQVVDQIQERNADKDPDEVKADVAAAVEEVRQEAHDMARFRKPAKHARRKPEGAPEKYPTVASLAGAAGSLPAPASWDEIRDSARDERLAVKLGLGS